MRTQERKGNSKSEIKETERQILPVSFCLELASAYDIFFSISIAFNLNLLHVKL